MSGGTELAEIERTLREAPAEYWRDESMQERYRELVEQPDAAPLPAQTRELSELQKLMGDRNSAYWKGPDADVLQSRYRDLVSERDGLNAAAPEWRTAPAEAMHQLPPALVSEWKEQGRDGFAISL